MFVRIRSHIIPSHRIFQHPKLQNYQMCNWRQHQWWRTHKSNPNLYISLEVQSMRWSVAIKAVEDIFCLSTWRHYLYSIDARVCAVIEWPFRLSTMSILLGCMQLKKKLLCYLPQICEGLEKITLNEHLLLQNCWERSWCRTRLKFPARLQC